MYKQRLCLLLTMMNFNNVIPLFFDADALQEGKKEYVHWDTAKAPHAIIFGQTGSGKSYGARLLLGRVSAHLASAKAVICTYKGGPDNDFSFLRDIPNARYFEYQRCREGFDFFYHSFQTRQSGDNLSRSFRLLVFDEWASYLISLSASALDRKAGLQEQEVQRLGHILMLGRSYNYHVLIIQQRGDSSFFATARDNLNLAVGLGALSKESKRMFFSNFKDEMAPVQEQGEGYMSVNGTLHHIQVPTVRDAAKLNEAIRRLVI